MSSQRESELRNHVQAGAVLVELLLEGPLMVMLQLDPNLLCALAAWVEDGRKFTGPKRAGVADV